MAGHYDEVFGPSGMPRRHWRRLTATVMRMGTEGLDRRWQQTRQLIQNNGVTYNVYGDPQGIARPWPLDAIPLVLSSTEWAHIEAAVVQRARLLNAVLADLYGPQTLIDEHRLPPGLLYENPGFLRPCRGITVPGNVFLFRYAVDLGRSPDGRWWVISDRTQAPSGVGYALENRLATAQTLPEAFQQSRVRRLTRFLETYRAGLNELAPHGGGSPRVVLLSAGPFSETFFEHAFLARYLGLTLVEGQDLVVRDDHVFLKTLSGLDPVDVILRRQTDAACDPMELDGNSTVGVPGLVQAARAGHVAIANALGSGLLSAPAFMGFLPGISRAVLGEDLLMPSVATWWCGQDDARRYVMQHMDQLVIKPAFPHAGRHSVFGSALSPEQRRQLVGEIEEHPQAFVGQERLALSTAPIWTDESFAARHVVLRVFASWSHGSYGVLPGGLTRVATSDTSRIVTMETGAGSKDTWVLSEGPESAPLPQLARQPTDVRWASSLPSRVAENFFWLGRYLERAEALVRITRVLLPALSSEWDLSGSVSVGTALRILAGYGYVPPGMTALHTAEQLRSLERALRSLLFDRNEALGLAGVIAEIRRIAWRLKARLSSDTWRVLNQLDSEFQGGQAPGGIRMARDLALLDRAVVTLSAFVGLMTDSMSRTHGWRFLDIGRHLERVLQLLHLLEHGVAVSGTNPEYTDVLLQVADSTVTYRTRYSTSLQVDLALELVLADDSNPRSVAFQLGALLSRVTQLPASRVKHSRPLEVRLIRKAITHVRAAQTSKLARVDEAGRRVGLIDSIETLRGDLEKAAEALASRYLVHARPSRLLASS